MSRPALRRVLYGALLLLFVLRIDLWQWNDPRRVLGLPVGLTYHIGICLAVSLIAGLLVCFAWPARHASADDHEGDA